MLIHAIIFMLGIYKFDLNLKVNLYINVFNYQRQNRQNEGPSIKDVRHFRPLPQPCPQTSAEPYPSPLRTSAFFSKLNFG